MSTTLAGHSLTDALGLRPLAEAKARRLAAAAAGPAIEVAEQEAETNQIFELDGRPILPADPEAQLVPPAEPEIQLVPPAEPEARPIPLVELEAHPLPPVELEARPADPEVEPDPAEDLVADTVPTLAEALVLDFTDLRNRFERYEAAAQTAAGPLASAEDLACQPIPPEAKAAKATALINALDPIRTLRAETAERYPALAAHVRALKASDADAETIQHVEGLQAGFLTASTRLGSTLPEGLYSLTQPSTSRLEKTLGVFANPDDPNAPDPAQDVTAAGANFKRVVEPYLTRGIDRADVFFDSETLTAPMSRADQATATEAVETMADSGRMVLYRTGRYEDVKTLMHTADIADQWWPPQLVDSVQAWRKTQRAVSKETVESFTQTKEDRAAARKALDWLEQQIDASTLTIKDAKAADDLVVTRPDFAPTVPGGAKNDTDAAETFAHAQELTNYLFMVTELKECLDSGRDFVKVVQGDPSGRTLKLVNDIAVTAADLADILNRSKAVSAASSVAGDHLAEVLPFLNIAKAVTKLLNGLARAQDDLQVAKQNTGLQDQATAGFGGDADLAQVNALMNEQAARSQQIAQDGVSLVTNLTDVARYTASAFGAHGAVASAAIEIAGAAIKHGSDIVFSAIDWSKAQKAQDTIRQAQAGNMVAQNEVFANSGFYAKMHICLLVRDKNPLAKKFIIDRGIKEGDLDSVQGLRILRESLLKSASQIDDTKVGSSLLDHVSGGMTGAVAGSASAAASRVADLGASAVTRHYDADWRFPGPVIVSAATWSDAKTQALAAGLVPGDGGEAKALGEAEAALTAAASLLQGAQDVHGTAKQTLLAAVDRIRAALDRLHAYHPAAFIGVKRVGHEGMAEFTAQMIATCNEREQDLWQGLANRQLCQTNWQPPQVFTTVDDLVRINWTTLWTQGMANACLPTESGVGPAFANLETVLAGLAGLTGKARRQKIVESRTACAALNTALLGVMALPEVSQQPKLIDAITAIMLLSNEKQRSLDAGLAGGGAGLVWQTPPGTDGQTLAACWRAVWYYACEGGFCDPALGDAGLGGKLAAFDAAAGKITSTTIDTPTVLRIYQDLGAIAGEVMLAASQFVQLHRESATGLTQFAQNLAQRAKDAARAKTASVTRPSIAAPALTAIPAAADWKRFYRSAVDAHVVLKSGTNEGLIGKALGQYAACRPAFGKAATPKDRRAAADTLSGALKALLQSVAAVSGYKDYGTAPGMDAYLTQLNTLATRELADPALTQATQGTIFTPPPAVTIDSDREWRQAKKTAVDNGIIPDKDTGMLDTLRAYIKANHALKGNPTAASAKHRDAAKLALQQLRSALTRVKGMSGNANWIAYTQELIALCDAQATALD